MHLMSSRLAPGTRAWHGWRNPSERTRERNNACWNNDYANRIVETRDCRRQPTAACTHSLVKIPVAHARPTGSYKTSGHDHRHQSTSVASLQVLVVHHDPVRRRCRAVGFPCVCLRAGIWSWIQQGIRSREGVRQGRLTRCSVLVFQPVRVPRHVSWWVFLCT